MEGTFLDFVFVAVTGFIAYHGLTYRDDEGKTEWVHMLFGCIAMLYCLRVLFVDIFGVI
jgi:hypothetical protein